MKRILSILGAFILVSSTAFATHNRAGEITFKLISGYTYEVTVTTFTFTQSAANRSQLSVEWGDNSASVAPLVSRTVLPNYYYHNIYTTRHTFPGPGNIPDPDAGSQPEFRDTEYPQFRECGFFHQDYYDHQSRDWQ